MRRLRNPLIGVDQGSTMLFSDFEHDGPMWTGTGPREFRTQVSFSEAYKTRPAVFATIDMWDFDKAGNLRGDVQTRAITLTGFQLVFRTWGDTRVARIRAAWQAIGEVWDDEQWKLY